MATKKKTVTETKKPEEKKGGYVAVRNFTFQNKVYKAGTVLNGSGVMIQTLLQIGVIRKC